MSAWSNAPAALSTSLSAADDFDVGDFAVGEMAMAAAGAFGDVAEGSFVAGSSSLSSDMADQMSRHTLLRLDRFIYTLKAQ